MKAKRVVRRTQFILAESMSRRSQNAANKRASVYVAKLLGQVLISGLESRVFAPRRPEPFPFTPNPKRSR